MIFPKVSGDQQIAPPLIALDSVMRQSEVRITESIMVLVLTKLGAEGCYNNNHGQRGYGSRAVLKLGMNHNIRCSRMKGI